MVSVAWLSLLLGAVPASSPPPPPLITDVPLDTLVGCLHDRLAPAGRVTAINTAAGTLLDFAFDSVGADGKVASAHLGFTAEDHGTERTLVVAAPSAADAGLAQQYQKQVGARCAPPAAHGAP